MQAFAGIRVLDLTHVLAGPFSTYQLAVLGADVIKIEGVHTFDMNREIGAVLKLSESLMGTHYQSQAANKRAMKLDLKVPAGKEVFLKLVSEADVVVENFRSGAMDRLGLGYEQLRAVKPDIIYCSLTGFGQTGPKREHGAFDNVIQAYSGMMLQTGPADDDAVLVGPPVLDYASGMQAAFAISSALLRRERTGRGQRLDVAMLDVALMLMTSAVLNANTTGKTPGRSRYARAPFAGYGGYETADDVLMVGAATPAQYKILWTVLGRDDLAGEMDELRTTDMPGTTERDEAIIAEVLKTKSAMEWEALFIEAGLPAARVRTINEALASEQVRGRQVVGSYATALSEKGEMNPAVCGFAASEDGPAITSAPPEYGEHTAAVLAEAGYSSEAIAELAERGVI